MLLAQGRRTEAGIQHILAQRLAAETARREAAESLLSDMRKAHPVEVVPEPEPVVTFIRPEYPHRSFRHLEAITCRLFKVTRHELRSDRRNRKIVLARQFLVYWTCRWTKLSLPQIGRLMQRDHTTVLSSRNVYPQKRAKMGRCVRVCR